MAVPSACSSPIAAFLPLASMTRKRTGPLRRRQACPASARRQPQSRAAKLGRHHPPAPSGVQTPSQSKQDLVIQMLRRQSGVTHRGHHRQDRLAAAFGAWLLQRPREKEAQASPRLRRGQGRRAPLSHRGGRIRPRRKPWRDRCRLARAARGGAGDLPPNQSKS